MYKVRLNLGGGMEENGKQIWINQLQSRSDPQVRPSLQTLTSPPNCPAD